MMNQPFPQDIYAKRRQRLAISMREKSGSGILILETAAEVYRNRDSDFPYRHDSDFYYLTGFNEPGATLVMTVSQKEVHTLLFCRPKDLEREIWDGWRLGPEAAPQYLGLDSAESIEKIDALLPAYIENQYAIYTRMIQGSKESAQLNQWLKKVKANARNGSATPAVLFDAETLIHEMRLFKDAHEIEIMRRAGKIAAAGHMRAMQHAKPGLHEYHLEAELLHTFRYNGAQSVAYNSIVASGANACVLHHRAGNTQLKDGDLCLIDAGCELDGYASDITRTFPVTASLAAHKKPFTNLS